MSAVMVNIFHNNRVKWKSSGRLCYFQTRLRAGSTGNLKPLWRPLALNQYPDRGETREREGSTLGGKGVGVTMHGDAKPNNSTLSGIPSGARRVDAIVVLPFKKREKRFDPRGNGSKLSLSHLSQAAISFAHVKSLCAQLERKVVFLFGPQREHIWLPVCETFPKGVKAVKEFRYQRVVGKVRQQDPLAKFMHVQAPLIPLSVFKPL